MLTMPRRSTILAFAFVAIFLMLVALILGPLLFKERNDHAIWYVLHIAGGTLVLALGPFQLVGALRKRFRRYHRVAGYAYAAASILAIAGYAGLPKIELFLTSQLVALSLWAVCVLLPYRPAPGSIRDGDVCPACGR
jgi:O-antigen/teichoic acid export membrane protein